MSDEILRDGMLETLPEIRDSLRRARDLAWEATKGIEPDTSPELALAAGSLLSVGGMADALQDMVRAIGEEMP